MTIASGSVVFASALVESGHTARTEVPVTLRLSQDAQAKLAERAGAAGLPLADYLARLVESLVETPRTLAEISGPVYQRFLESGTTDDQLSDELERAKHAKRADRGRRASRAPRRRGSFSTATSSSRPSLTWPVRRRVHFGLLTTEARRHGGAS